MSTAKRYTVLSPFREQDPKTGKITRFKPGGTYSGSNVELYLTGMDDPKKGHLDSLIAESGTNLAGHPADGKED